MEQFAHVDTASDELGARCLDIGYHEKKSACRAWNCRRGSLAEVDGAGRARRRELHATKRIALDEVGVEPPTQLGVEALGAIVIRDRDDDTFELHLDRRRGGRDVRFGHSGS